MKTRSRERHRQQQGATSGEHLPAAAGQQGQSRPLTTAETGTVTANTSQPQSVSDTLSVAMDRKGHQDITTARSVLTGTPHAQNVLTGTPQTQNVLTGTSKTQSVLSGALQAQHITSSQSLPPRLGGSMAEGLSLPHHSPEQAPPFEQAVCVHVQGVQYSTSDRQTSPVQLTELVSPSVSKTCCPPSDKNHNLPPMYVTSSGALLCPTSLQYVEAGHQHPPPYPDPPVAGSAGFATAYYHDLNDGKKTDVPSSSLYSISPESCVYPKDGLYPPQYSLDSQSCKVFTFCTMDTGREYSPPEMSAYSSSSSTSYTSPLTSSVLSAGSPDPLHWSPNTGTVLTPDLCLPKVTAAQPAPPPPEGMPDSGKSSSETQSSAHTAPYYSDEQSLEEDAMRDIKRDILSSDIHKHIYHNFSSHSLAMSPLDEDSHDDDDNDTDSLSPGPHVPQGKAGGGPAKKRRRRTQTPVQRKAANMRERKRMCHLNKAFNHLKDRLPNVRSRKKLSRIQTLKAAIFYIGLLTECLQSS
ncbi:uncharacterized protein LOC143279404 [Babylonia areolata]|uniref:uncharacterized protein LOC143279404 n=1 Tax=Babylonia areolata TaxID=304850 RepID=UPI003FD5C4C6